MADNTTMTWRQDMAFDMELGGHKFAVDAAEEHGGTKQGPKPKPLVLSALAGCTAMDVVAILKKMRVEFADFSVSVSGELTDEHPKVYHKVHIDYHLKGNDIDRAKVEKAVDLSQNRYCGVSAMLKSTAEITSDIHIE